MKEYFKDVPRDIMEELKSLFKIDFEMFGYSYDDIWFPLKNSNIWNISVTLTPCDSDHDTPARPRNSKKESN